MKEFKQFREKNGLTQGDVADYLAVTRAFISQVESGYSRLPQDKLTMLVENTNGWDTSMLNVSNNEGNVQIIQGDNKGKVTQINKCPSMAEMKARIAELESIIATERRELDWLRQLVEKYLTNK